MIEVLADLSEAMEMAAVAVDMVTVTMVEYLVKERRVGGKMEVLAVLQQ